MKLLILTQTIDLDDPILGFFHGWILTFAQHFERIDVICLREGRHTFPEHVHIHSLGKEDGESRLKYIARFYRFFAHIFFKVRVDYVFYHMGAVYNILAVPFFLLRSFFNTSFFWWKTHGKVGALKERLALMFVDKIFTAGSKSFDIKSDKVHVVGHAIDVEQFIQSESHKPTRCLIVGRLVPIKKIEIAIQAFSLVCDEVPGATLDIVGGADDPGYGASLKELSEGTSATIRFQGNKLPHQMPDVYAQAGILLHPAYEAGFDKVVLEAMASGVIPITSIPSFQSILEPFGLYVEQNEIETYAKTMLSLMSMSEGDLQLLRTALREIVMREHSLGTLSQRIFGKETIIVC